MKKKYLLLAIVLAVSLLMANNASAYLIYLTDANTELGGLNKPSNYAGYYATVNVTLQTGSTTIANVLATAGPGYEFVDSSALALNVNATSFGVGTISPSGWGTTAGYLIQNVDQMGYFNLTIDSTPSAGPAQTLSFTIQNTSGVDWTSDSSILAEAFYYDLSNPNNPKDFAKYMAAAHIRPIGNALTGYAGGSSTTTPVVPIPAAVWLLGSGLVGLVVIRRRFKK